MKVIRAHIQIAIYSNNDRILYCTEC